MNAILRYASKENVRREGVAKTDIRIFGAGRVEGFEAAFAVAVMLGALWLLLTGYV